MPSLMKGHFLDAKEVTSQEGFHFNDENMFI